MGRRAPAVPAVEVGHLNRWQPRSTRNNRPMMMTPSQVEAGTKTGDSNGVSYNYGRTGAADRALGNIPDSFATKSSSWRSPQTGFTWIVTLSYTASSGIV